MTRRRAALVPMIFLAACGSASPTSPSGFRTTASASTPAVPPTTTVPSPQAGGPFVLPGTPISAGVRTEVRVEGTDLRCFFNWDASGHCSHFHFVAPTDGTVRVSLELPSPSRGLHDPEAFLVTPSGDWNFTADSWPIRHVTIAARSGLTYGIIVMSYGPFPDTVYLKVDFP